MNRFDMRRGILFFALILFEIQVSGQVNNYGVPIIRNYSTQITHGSEQNWCITKDSGGNLYFGNNNNGVAGRSIVEVHVGNRKGESSACGIFEATAFLKKLLRG